MKRRLAALLALLSTLTLTTLAAGADDKTAKAKDLFEAGGRAYDKAQYDVALQAFQQAYDLVQRDGILFSIAQTHRRLYTTTGRAEHYNEALRLYRDYLSRAPSGNRKSEAVQAIEDLQGRPPKVDGATPVDPRIISPVRRTLLAVDSATPGVLVSIDNGAPVPPDSFEVAPGKHTVRFTAEGFVEKTVEVETTAGELSPVSRDLEEKPGKLKVETESGAEVSLDGVDVGEAPLSAPLSAKPGPHFVAVELSGHKTRWQNLVVERDKSLSIAWPLDTTVQRDLSFGFFAAAGGAAIAAGVLTGFTLVKQSAAQTLLDKRDTESISTTEADDYASLSRQRDQFALAASLAGGGAGALLVVGLGLYLVDPPDRPPPPTTPGAPDTEKKNDALPVELAGVVPVIGPDGGGLALTLLF